MRHVSAIYGVAEEAIQSLKEVLGSLACQLLPLPPSGSWNACSCHRRPPPMPPSSNKRRCLSRLCGIGGVSDAALSQILAVLHKSPPVGPASRQACNLAARLEYDDEMALSLDLPLKEEPWTAKWWLCKPTRLVQRSVEVSPALRRLFARSTSSPVAPWTIVLAHDEITPGAILRPDNARKFNSFYFTFAELGHHAIMHDVCWFNVAVLRSKLVDQVDGGLSCCLRLLLRALLVEESNFSSGVVLPLDDGPTLLFARFGMHLGDEAALSRGLNIKGAAGIRPCFKCSNVLKKGSGLAQHRPAELVEISCLDPARFSPNSDSKAFSAHDRLSGMQGRTSVAEFRKHEVAMGMSFCRHGLLADADLRSHVAPVSSMRYDWQHTYLSNGIAAQEMHRFLASCKASGIADIWPLLEKYCQANWLFPNALASNGRDVHKTFNKYRAKASEDHWKSGASELLSAYPLVRWFAENVLAERFSMQLQHPIESFKLCCKVLDLLQDAKGGVTDTSGLDRAIRAHLEKHMETYGDADWRPKLHYALHIPEQVSAGGCCAVNTGMIWPCAAGLACTIIANASAQEAQHDAGALRTANRIQSER